MSTARTESTGGSLDGRLTIDGYRIASDAIAVLTGSLLIALSAQARVFLPGNPIPITLQTGVVLSLPFFLHGWRAPAAVAAYLLQGLAGLPFFASGQGGAAYFVGAGGYLVGFLVAAALVSVLREKLPSGWRGSELRERAWRVISMASGNVLIYLVGVPWLAIAIDSYDVGRAIALGMLPFLIGDGVKILAASLILPRPGSRQAATDSNR